VVRWGEQDPALSTALLDGLADLVDDCLRVERFPAASHWLPADEPGPVAGHLREWFEADA
jgi:pimeloyl-ACP methyl ester carboxylesterase